MGSMLTALLIGTVGFALLLAALAAGFFVVVGLYALVKGFVEELRRPTGDKAAS